MRQVLVGYEREKGAGKRGGGLNKCTLEDVHAVMTGQPVDLLDLDSALTELSRLDPEQGRIVELRFFGGLSIEETALVLGKSPATVKGGVTVFRINMFDKTGMPPTLGDAPPSDQKLGRVTAKTSRLSLPRNPSVRSLRRERGFGLGYLMRVSDEGVEARVAVERL